MGSKKPEESPPNEKMTAGESVRTYLWSTQHPASFITCCKHGCQVYSGIRLQLSETLRKLVFIIPSCFSASNPNSCFLIYFNISVEMFFGLLFPLLFSRFLFYPFPFFVYICCCLTNYNKSLFVIPFWTLSSSSPFLSLCFSWFLTRPYCSEQFIRKGFFVFHRSGHQRYSFWFSVRTSF